jgi:dienelactone hydrolase
MKLPYRNHSLPILCALSLGAIVSAASAAESLDLKRITPVPATEPVPAMDFFRPLMLQDPKLNPSGSHIAAIVTAAEDQHQLLVYDLDTKKIEMAGAGGDKDIYRVYWLNDRRLVFELGSRKLYGIGLFAADVGSISDPYPLLQYYGTSVIAVPPKNRLRPLVWNRWSIDTDKDQGGAVVNTDIHSAAAVDLTAAGDRNWSAIMDARDNNEKHIVKRFPVPSSGLGWEYFADKEGQLEFAITSQDGLLELQHLAGDHWEKCPVDPEQIEIIGYGEQPGQLVVMGPQQEGKPRALQFMDGPTGKLGEVLLQDDAYDFFDSGLGTGWLYRDPITHAVVGAVFERNGPRVVWFTEEYRKLQKILDSQFPGLVVRIVSMNEAQTRFLVATFSDRQPLIYSWVDLEKHTAGLFKNSAPWIDPQRMQPQNIIKFKTRDGRQLDAYLTLPAGASKKNPPPLVVLPHGGPWARDGWGFDGEAQFLASRGYAVLKPNYRGSNGYNWMFPYEDRYDFRKMHDDVTDATKTMIASGLIDGGRVAIMGGSFGGYLAVSGVVNEPKLYRCAVTIAGVFDWEQQLKDKKYDQYDSPVYGYLKRRLGDPKKSPEKFDAISPGRHVDQIRVPVFVSAGREDSTVEYEQSRTLISALEKYHVPHETLIKGGEGHGMGHLDNRVELYTRIEAFLDKNLKSAPAAATVP